ncbi:MAG: hypothetical protein BHW58_04585 [Azospirillum sp. 51_20]|nr:MAG: hypothetical protein BHW58_04585 [Azospirillum sp. 51_20]
MCIKAFISFPSAKKIYPFADDSVVAKFGSECVAKTMKHVFLLQFIIGIIIGILNCFIDFI